MGDYPPELDAVADDTAPRRVAASGVPDPAWTWGTAPLAAGSPAARAADLLRAWSRTGGDSSLRGVVLHGGAGLGKTGMAACVVRDAAERRDGESGYWALVTAPAVVEAVAAGEFRRRPAPASFYRWRDLKSLLDRAKSGQAPWDETPPLTAEKVLAEIEARCAVLALDDVDVDALTPWKEEVLLRLLELPSRRRRFILTLNTDPVSPDGVARLGERVVDRLMDPAVFARFHVTGDSLRRRR